MENSAASPPTASPVSYRAILNGTSDLPIAGEIMNIIEDWRESRGTLLNILSRLRLAKKSECQLSSDESEC